MNLYTAVNNVLKRLDDYPSVSGESVWTRAEIQQHVEDGYNAFCRQTKCILDFFYPENIPTAGNYMAKWEEGYFDSGMIAIGLLGFSGGYWEQDYAEASQIGPINHTQPWEADYLTTTFTVSRVKVADDNIAVDRVTHDFHTLEPEYTRFFERTNKNFQTTSGEPWRYTMDRDGIGYMRVVPAGAGNATSYDAHGKFGLLRRPEYVPTTAYWTLDETSGTTRADTMGLVDLTAVNGPSIVDGRYGKALLFSTNQYLTSVTHPLDVEGGDVDLSVSFWVKPTAGTPTIDQYVLVGIYDDWKVYISGFGSLSNYFRFAWWEDDGTVISTSSSPLVTYGSWHFVVAWRDKTAQTINIQVDFDRVVSAPSTGGGQSSAEAFGIGAYAGGTPAGGKPFEGIIDDVRVYHGLWTDDQKAILGEAHTGELGLWAPTGSWGTLREIPEHFPMGAPYGVPRRLYSDDSNTRVEYFRLGKDLDEYLFELPDRFVKYVEFYAQAKALERDGPGQDLALSNHFMGRFGDGVSRMASRMAEMKRSRVGAIGGGNRVPTRLATARLPWRYGRKVAY